MTVPLLLLSRTHDIGMLASGLLDGSLDRRPSSAHLLRDHDGLTFSLDVPGCGPDAVTVSGLGDRCVIEAVRDGIMSRHVLRLGRDLDPSTIRADVTDGVLMIRVPRVHYGPVHIPVASGAALLLTVPERVAVEAVEAA